MKYFIKFTRNILIFVLSILLFLLIFIWCIMGSTKNLFSEKSLNKMLKSIDFNEFLNNEVGEKIYTILEDAGIPKDYAKEILNDEEVKNYASRYMSEVVNYIIEPSEVPKIDEVELSNILKTSFDETVDMVNKYTEDVNSDYVNKFKEQITDERREKVKQKIDEYTPQIVEAIPSIEEFIENKISENDNLSNGIKSIEQLRNELRKVKRIYNFQNIILVIIFIIIGLITLLKFKKFKFIKWIIWPFILCGFGLIMFVYFSNSIIDRIISEINYFPSSSVKGITSIALNNFQNYGYICFLIASFLLLLCIIIMIFTHIKNRPSEKNPV